MSTLPTVVYRTESFPGLGFLLKKSFFDLSMKHHMNECCMNRSVVVDVVVVAAVAVVVVAVGIPQQQPHRHSGLATLPSAGAIP